MSLNFGWSAKVVETKKYPPLSLSFILSEFHFYCYLYMFVGQCIKIILPADKHLMNFEEIFNTHKERVFSLCFRYLQQEQEAEDAVQEVFVKVFYKLDTFKAESQIGTWIYRIAINHCLDILKSKKRKQQILRFVSFLPFVAENMGQDESKLEDKEAYQQLQNKLHLLPEKQLTALVLNKLEGLSIDQVAQIMSLSYKAVESLLQRGKQNLQKYLKEAKE